jgi:hypothetical protein
MQYSFSLNNSGVSPSNSNPVDSVSEVVQLLSHQMGEKPKKQNKQNKQKKQKTKTKQYKNPKFKWNLTPSASNSSSVIVSSKEEKKRKKKSLETAL